MGTETIQQQNNVSKAVSANQSEGVEPDSSPRTPAAEFLAKKPFDKTEISELAKALRLADSTASEAKAHALSQEGMWSTGDLHKPGINTGPKVETDGIKHSVSRSEANHADQGAFEKHMRDFEDVVREKIIEPLRQEMLRQAFKDSLKLFRADSDSPIQNTTPKR